MYYYNEHNPFMTFFAFIFLFFMYLAIDLLKNHWCLPRSRSHHTRRPAMVFFTYNTASSRGLDPSVLNSLPVFTFSSSDVATHRDPIDCAVCLSAFEEGESGRVLPGCKHAFHVECIDMWFHSHSTCPLCRTLVELPSTTTVEEQVTVITLPPEPVVSATEPAIEVWRMSRMLSFTRMLSIDRRSAPSSSVGAPSQSPSSSCRTVVTESDIERGGEEIK